MGIVLQRRNNKPYFHRTTASMWVIFPRFRNTSIFVDFLAPAPFVDFLAPAQFVDFLAPAQFVDVASKNLHCRVVVKVFHRCRCLSSMVRFHEQQRCQEHPSVCLKDIRKVTWPHCSKKPPCKSPELHQIRNHQSGMKFTHTNRINWITPAEDEDTMIQGSPTRLP